MDPETILISGISAVTSALVAVVAKLWQRSEKCESDRIEMREKLEHLISARSHAEGLLEAVENCPAQGCPFTATAETKTARIPRFKPMPPPEPT